MAWVLTLAAALIAIFAIGIGQYITFDGNLALAGRWSSGPR